MRVTKVAVVLFTLMTAPLAWAKDELHMITAKELADMCRSNEPTYCHGFVDGAIQGMEGFASDITVLGTYTREQCERAFLVYLDAHPEHENLTAIAVLFRAWRDHEMIRVAKPRKPPNQRH